MSLDRFPRMPGRLCFTCAGYPDGREPYCLRESSVLFTGRHRTRETWVTIWLWDMGTETVTGTARAQLQLQLLTISCNAALIAWAQSQLLIFLFQNKSCHVVFQLWKDLGGNVVRNASVKALLRISTEMLPEVKVTTLSTKTSNCIKWERNVGIRAVSGGSVLLEWLLDFFTRSPFTHVLTRHSSEQSETIRANWLIQQETWERWCWGWKASGWQG